MAWAYEFTQAHTHTDRSRCAERSVCTNHISNAVVHGYAIRVRFPKPMCVSTHAQHIHDSIQSPQSALWFRVLRHIGCIWIAITTKKHVMLKTRNLTATPAEHVISEWNGGCPYCSKRNDINVLSWCASGRALVYTDNVCGHICRRRPRSQASITRRQPSHEKHSSRER